MKDKITMNMWGFVSLVILGSWMQYCRSIIGALPTTKNNPYTFWEALLVFGVVLFFWILGYISNFNKQK